MKKQMLRNQNITLQAQGLKPHRFQALRVETMTLSSAQGQALISTTAA
jgi:hypothetical protein